MTAMTSMMATATAFRYLGGLNKLMHLFFYCWHKCITGTALLATEFDKNPVSYRLWENSVLIGTYKMLLRTKRADDFWL